MHTLYSEILLELLGITKLDGVSLEYLMNSIVLFNINMIVLYITFNLLLIPSTKIIFLFINLLKVLNSFNPYTIIFGNIYCPYCCLLYTSRCV